MRHTNVELAVISSGIRVLEDVDKDDVELEDVELCLKGAEASR
jgi:hypothetical protein